MPFTFSHPAAILPAKYLPEKWVSLTALVMGSIAPDFEYFMRMSTLGLYGHTLVGIFWFDLPIAFILTFIYHAFVRDSLLDNLPHVFRKRLSRFKGFNWPTYVKQHFIIVLVCLLIGIITHIVWDSFTHRNGYFVSKIPWLLKNTDVFGVGQVRFYILQVVSSIVGLALVAYALLKIPADETIGKKSIYKYWLVAALITILIVTVRVYVGLHRLPLEHIFQLHFYRTFFTHPSAQSFIMTVISAFLLSLILTPFVIKRKA